MQNVELGRLPQGLMAVLMHDLADTCQVGDAVEMTGVILHRFSGSIGGGANLPMNTVSASNERMLTYSDALICVLAPHVCQLDMEPCLVRSIIVINRGEKGCCTIQISNVQGDAANISAECSSLV